ncbi:hypothetical protein [Actinomadura bangladeshensis]|uniref:hypothetical protein n=1 Tax=Actinomadura bangladeshensis TaxID=453573 RepID=UPI001944E40C|nr:hypothetical protein [Actinomadura bangladeshensis]
MVIGNRTGHAPAIAELRERGPVHPIDFPRGVTAFLVVDHEHGRAALSDPRLSKDIAHSSVPIDGEQLFGGTMLIPALTAEARARRRDAAREFNAYLVKDIAERRARPEDDLISALLGARDRDAARSSSPATRPRSTS